MGQPQDACFRQQSPFVSLTTTTSTSTTTEPDFFIFPASGKPCPHGFSKSIGAVKLLEPPIQNDILTFTCDNEANDPNPCIRTSPKYIKISEIVLFPFDCNRYRLSLSGADKDYFTINNLNLYIDGNVLDFNKPTKSYNVEVNVLDPVSSDLSSSANFSVAVSSCPCDYIPTITTTTSTTTSTTTTIAPSGSSECAQLLALELKSQGAFDISFNENVVFASIKAVSNEWIINQQNKFVNVWGNPIVGYKIDSFWPYVIVHTCIASPNQTIRLKLTTSITGSNTDGSDAICLPTYIFSKPWASPGICVAKPEIAY